MSQDTTKSDSTVPAEAARTNRRAWRAPELRELPRLTDLTLQTGSAIPGFGDTGGGSTVF